MHNIFILSCHHFNVTRGVETYNENLAKLLSSFESTDKVYILGLEGSTQYHKKNYKHVNLPFPKVIYDLLLRIGGFPFLGRILSKIPFCHPWNILNYLFYRRAIKEINSCGYDKGIVVLSGPGWSANDFLGFKTVYVGHSGGGKADVIGSSSVPDYYISINSLDKSQVSGKKYIEILNTVSFSLLNDAKTYFSSKNLLDRTIDILFVGAFIDEKRPLEILDALIYLDVPLKVLFLGQGPLEKRLLRRAKRTKVTLTTMSVPHSEISNYYKVARIFVLPSKHEPFGLVYREAAIFGCMVIAPDDKVRRIVAPNAIFFPRGQLANSLKYCLSVVETSIEVWERDLNLEQERQETFISTWRSIINE